MTNDELNEEWRKRAEARLVEACERYIASRCGLEDVLDAAVDLADLQQVREPCLKK